MTRNIAPLIGDHQARPGQRVTFTFQPVAQDGFGYQALDVTIEGIPAGRSDSQPTGPGYQSQLTTGPD